MRHPVNTAHLVAGLVFLGIAGSWALRASGVLEPDSLDWLLPLVLVGAGIAGLLATVAKGLTRGAGAKDGDPASAYDPEEGAPF